jgi:hypothetical protein
MAWVEDRAAATCLRYWLAVDLEGVVAAGLELRV